MILVKEAPSFLNLSIYFNVDGTVKLNGGFALSKGADVTTADQTATNGTIHIINKVLLPPTVVDMALANPNFSNLVASLTTAGQPDFVSVLSTPNGTSVDVLISWFVLIFDSKFYEY